MNKRGMKGKVILLCSPLHSLLPLFSMSISQSPHTPISLSLFSLALPPHPSPLFPFFPLLSRLMQQQQQQRPC